MGPSRANPLTGEILDADIIFDAEHGPLLEAGARSCYGRRHGRCEPASPIQATATRAGA